MRHRDWIVPDWPAPPNVRALVTTRAGGASAGPFATLNLGTATGDDPAAVAKNRAILRKALPADPVWLKQVHGARVIAADTQAGEPTQADASFARNTATVCAILVADCLPVLLTDTSGSVVAAAHCGWRGLAAGVVANTVAAMRAAGATDDLLAYIGPGIGNFAFEVGEDVFRAYTTADGESASAFEPRAPGKWLADLPMLARRALSRAGVKSIHDSGVCTYSDPLRFYSYRRDRTTGRFAALIWRS